MSARLVAEVRTLVTREMYGRGPAGWLRERRTVRTIARAAFGITAPWWWSNGRVRRACRRRVSGFDLTIEAVK